MKTHIVFSLALLLSLLSCERKSNDSLVFEAEVLGNNMDCGLPYIRFIDNLDKVIEISDSPSSNSVFIAKNLPITLQTEGLIIELEIRKIQNSELGLCTAMGPDYPWIYVLQAKIKE